jgi:hypothetical protein
MATSVRVASLASRSNGLPIVQRLVLDSQRQAATPFASSAGQQDASRVRKSPTILSILRSFALNLFRFGFADALWCNAMNLSRVLASGGT